MRGTFVALVVLTALAASAAGAESPPTEGTDGRLTHVEGKLSSLEEQNKETSGVVRTLSRLRFSGYIQGRYEYRGADEVERAAGPVRLTPGSSSFLVRRARLAARYGGDVGELRLQVDAVPGSVSIRDAEATLFLPYTRQAFGLTLGQTKWPVGFEVLQSSSVREFPERSRVVLAFARGERDRGIKLNGKVGPWRLNLGLFDGNGTQNRAPATGTLAAQGADQTSDNDKMKDVVGRLGFDLKWVTGGVTGWYGNTIRPTLNTNLSRGQAVDRTRLGADVQVFLDLLPIGGTQVRGEYLTGKTYWAGALEQYDLPASGWYAAIVQNIGRANLLALRYDYFDPRNGLGNSASTTNPERPGGANPIGTWTAAATHFFGEHVKLTAAYELPLTSTSDLPDLVEDPEDSVFTLQLQAMF